MFLIQQLYLLQNVLPHLGESGAGLLPTAQHQAVFIVAGADAVQRLSHRLEEEEEEEEEHKSLLRTIGAKESSGRRSATHLSIGNL